MQRVRFGRTKMQVSRLGLGCTSFGSVHEAADWNPALPTGRKVAIDTIHAAVEHGINYFDTAPAYGDGLSEDIVGEALQPHRDQVYIATKCAMHLPSEGIRQSLEDSLRRLRTEYVDLLQFHGGTYSPEDTQRILHDGPLETLHALRDEGKLRYIGFTSNENGWPCEPLIASGQFDTCQLQYNLMNQASASTSIPAAQQQDMGITVMRPLTSGALLDVVQAIAPKWHEHHDVYEVALAFVLSDSRIHMVNTGMRWRHEVERNVAFVNNFEPTVDFAHLRRSVNKRYRHEDEKRGDE